MPDALDTLHGRFDRGGMHRIALDESEIFLAEKTSDVLDFPATATVIDADHLLATNYQRLREI